MDNEKIKILEESIKDDEERFINETKEAFERIKKSNNSGLTKEEFIEEVEKW